jgi:hypothetical protein
MMKDFREHFFMLYNKLKNNENFAFSRFSDGELRIMQNKELILSDNYNKIGDVVTPGHYHPEDKKHFNPVEHPFVHDKLMEAYRFKKHNYYVGLSCRCCVGDEDFQQMVDWRGGDDEFLTWSNLWVNGNYDLFRQYMIPEFTRRRIVYTLNRNANVAGLSFIGINVVKDFRIGENCIVNEFNKHEEVAKWIEENNIKNHVFLFSASSLSNFMIYELFKKYDENTYIDIGTTLNAELGMKGLRGYLYGQNRKICIW